MLFNHAGRQKVYLSLALLVAMAALAPVALRAQAPTGTIGGTVTDATGATIPGAKVTIFNVRQNREERVVTADTSGNYVAPYLSVSTYNVTVEAPGFKKAVRESIVLNVDDHLAINVALEVGATKQTVTVEDTPVHIETSSSVMSTTVNGTQIREEALITRNYERLVSLMPGVVSNSVDQLYPGVSVPGGTATNPYSINGSRNSMNAWLVDGADNEDRGSNQTLLNTPSVDALEEFKVARNGYEAQEGRAGSAQIEVVTKSGTAAFHGDAYEFVRNNAFAANNFYNNATNVNLINGTAAVPALRYNNFGWTLGGPIYIPGHYNTEKDKTFFFFSEEFRRIITYTTPTATLPTLAEVQGTFPNAVCTSYTGSTCNTTSTTITTIDPVAQEYIKDIYNRIPLPAGTNTLPLSADNYFGFEQELYKVDQVFGPKLTLSARFLRDQIPTAEPGGLFQLGALPAVYETSTNAPGHNWVVHATSTLSPTWLNEAGYSFSYGAIISNPVGLANSTYSTDIKATLPYPVTLTLVPTLAFAGNGTGVGSEGNYRDFNRNHQVFDNVSKIHGPHTLRFGFTYYHYQKTENAAGGNQGSFSFTPPSVPSGATTYQQSWANFLLGNVSSFTQTSLDITPDIRANQYEMYAQDDWKMKSNLTFNFGVRYSIFRQPTDAKGQNVDFDPALYSAANAPKLVVGSTNATLPVGTPLPYTNGVILGGKNSPFGTAAASQDNRDFAPRLGFAWDPFKTGKTSVRGGYGIYYDATLYGIYEQNIFADPPIVNSVNIPNTTLSNPTGGTASVSYSPIGLHATTSQFHTPYVQQWSLEIQREVAHNFQLNVGYVGSKGTHLLGIVDINNAAPGLAWSSGLVSSSTVFTSANEGLLNALRPYQGYNYINNIEPWFNSNYHSLQISGQRHFAGSSYIGFAYTWSRAMTDNASDRSNAPQSDYNFNSGEYGRSTFDRTHVFNVNFVYELPIYKHQPGVAGKALGGWQVSGIATYYTGLPQTVTVTGTTAWSGDPAGLGIIGSSAASLRPDMVCNPNSGGAHTRTSWFSGSCFAPVPSGVHRPGNEGRDDVLGPGYEGWDLSLAKTVTFGPGERFRFQLRGEATNAFNHPNPSGFGSLNPTSTLFNTITSYRDPRLIQIGAKFYW